MASPNILNYTVSRGWCFFTPTGGTERNLGNIVEFGLEPGIEKLDHFSTQGPGIRVKDRSIVLEQTLTATITMDEWTADNVRFALMGGAVTASSDGHRGFRIFAATEITGALRFEGRSSVGSKVHLDLPNVSFTPSGSLSMISDEWGTIEVEAEVLFDAAIGDFGFCEVDEAV